MRFLLATSLLLVSGGSEQKERALARDHADCRIEAQLLSNREKARQYENRLKECMTYRGWKLDPHPSSTAIADKRKIICREPAMAALFEQCWIRP